MTSNPHAAAALLSYRRQQRFAGISATYRRGNASVALCVVPGRQGQIDQGVSTSSSMNTAQADFEIAACDLQIDNEELVPQPGDLLEVTFDCDRDPVSFQAALGPSRRVWDWGDNYRQIRTCHYVPTPTAT